MQRHKTIYHQTGGGISRRAHWNPISSNPDGTIGSWEFTNDTFPPTNEKRLFKETRDDQAWALPCMQDLVQTSLDWYHESQTRMGLVMTPNPGLNTRYYSIGFPGESISLTDSYVIDHLVDDTTGIPWTPLDAVRDGFGSSALYQRLVDDPIRSVMREISDPLESGFSIWYLVRDLKDTGKLLKGFIKNALRVKSIMCSTGSLKSIFEKRSMKEFASSHLAIQYGLLPTIADIRDFCRVVLAWYEAWVTKSNTLGSVRTIHGPRRAVTGDEAERVVRLRFLAYGGQNHYVNARFTPGTVISSQTLKYHFICPELTNLMSVLKHTIDTLGVLDPAALWDVVPFSFVLDWFLDVTKLLHAKKPRLFPVTLVIDDWAEGLSCQTEVELLLDYVGSTAYNRDSESVVSERLCVVTVRQRVRKRQFPHELIVDPANLIGKGLTLRRTINGLAIIVGKHARGTKPGKATRYRNRPTFIGDVRDLWRWFNSKKRI